MLDRYSGFLNNLRESPSTEVRFLVNVVAKDPSSNTAGNIKYIEELTGTCPWSSPVSRVKATLPVKVVPDSEKWRLGLLQSLLQLREKRSFDILNTTRVTSMIDSLCST